MSNRPSTALPLRGDNRCVHRLTEPDEIAPYLTDESRWAGGDARAVLLPDSTAEALEALREAATSGERVTCSGAGTGVAAGRVPAGGVVLATDRLRRVLDVQVDPGRQSGTIRVQAGATWSDIQAAARAHDLFYPPDPTEWSASIGGMIATNASGARSFKFGATRRWVRALEVALVDGTLLSLRRGAVREAQGSFRVTTPQGVRAFPAPDWRLPAVSKHASGYWSAPQMDLIDLFIGSEGSLGLVLEAELELMAAPAGFVGGVLFFATDRSLFACARAARAGECGVEPICLEYIDAHSLELARPLLPALPSGVHSALFFEQIAAPAEIAAALQAWTMVAEQHGANPDSWLVEDSTSHRRLRELRHAIPTAVNERLASRGVPKTGTDSALPRGTVSSWLDRARLWLDSQKLEHATFGHVGDDHLHVNILASDAGEVERARAAHAELTRWACAAGGNVSAEHGLGKAKRRLWEQLTSPRIVARTQQIQQAFDPEGRLGR